MHVHVFPAITKLSPYTLLPPASCACMQSKYCNPLTRWPSTRVLKPSPVIALKYTNTVTQGYYVCDSNVQEATTTIKMGGVWFVGNYNNQNGGGGGEGGTRRLEG